MENLFLWSERMNGARLMLAKLRDDANRSAFKNKYRFFDADKVYDDACCELVMSNIDNTQKFLDGDVIHYRNHQQDKKGKLIKVEAYFKTK